MHDMKHTSIRVAFLGATLALAPTALLAQSADPMTPPPSSAQPGSPTALPATNNPMTQDSSAAPGLTGQMMQDKIFVRKAFEGSLSEVQLGQLAAQKGSTDEVKAFGQKMVTDHTAINEAMKPVADSLGVMLPKKVGKEGQANYDMLSKLSGEDFDKQYITLMVKDHHQDLKEFREELAKATDPGLKDEILSSGKVIREHTMMVDKMATEKGIPVPARPPRPAPTHPVIEEQ